MFLTETHLHTLESSHCGKIFAAEMVELYKAAGYKTLFITDHFANYNFSQLGGSWSESVENFLYGYRLASAAGEKLGVNIILGAELTFKNQPNDYLLIGVTEEFLYSLEGVFDSNIKEFYQLAKAHNITVIQAHPFRDNNCFATPEAVDGLECYNSNPRHSNYTKKAIATAQEHKLLITAGSDAHRHEDIAGTGIITDREIKTAQDYIGFLKNGKFDIKNKEELL